MIKLTWGNLRDDEFMRSMGKLYDKPMGFEFGMKFAILGRDVKKQQELMRETHEKILKKYGTLDPEHPQKGVYKINEETKDEYEKEIEKLFGHSFECKISKFDALQLSEVVKFSPQDLMLLEPLFLPFEIPTESSDGKSPGLKTVPSDGPELSPSH